MYRVLLTVSEYWLGSVALYGNQFAPKIKDPPCLPWQCYSLSIMGLMCCKSSLSASVLTFGLSSVQINQLLPGQVINLSGISRCLDYLSVWGVSAENKTAIKIIQLPNALKNKNQKPNLPKATFSSQLHYLCSGITTPAWFGFLPFLR